MKFIGIRKPRTYSNQAFSNASGWLLPASFSVGAGPMNWNMSAEGWASWWIPRTAHFISEGLDAFWNDEGETQWFTYSWWNAAQAAAQASVAPLKRFWSINRSFQPGMQTFAATSWTGDQQDCSHRKMLAFAVAGQLYSSCDMTSPSATVLVRQYQNAIFSPIMRVHQMHGVPRFPWLWGGDEHRAAFRGALEMRYHFLPHLYSLAHASHAALTPIVAPASYIFPADASFPPAAGDAVLMVGDTLLPSVVSTSNGPDPNENVSTSVLPPGLWYRFNSTEALPGLQTVTYADLPLSTAVLFVRAGAILALQRDVIQHAGEVGGVLELHVYAGRDGAFTLTEDDGATTAYATAPAAATRATAFAWSDATRTLSWKVAGAYVGAQSFTSAEPVLFTANASAPVKHAPVALGASGSISF
jgi:alpha-glucosidase (family GH31 glycosyl hydrolase)